MSPSGWLRASEPKPDGDIGLHLSVQSFSNGLVAARDASVEDRLRSEVVSGGVAETIEVVCESSTGLKSAQLNYTIDSGLRSQRNWTTVQGKIQGKVITFPKPPPDANTWFITVVDERGAMVSTAVEFSP